MKKFGTFNYAQINTLLDIEMLDRHLSNMIPNAGKLLARSSIPSPIPNPSIKDRRQPVSERRRTPTVTPVAMKKLDRNMTQSMSLNSQKSRLQDVNTRNIESTQKRSTSIGLEQYSPDEATKKYKPKENVIDSAQKNASIQTETPKKTKNLESSKQNVQKPIILNSPEMVAMFNAIIEKDPEKMNECIQKSLADSLSGFLFKNSS